MKFLGRLVLSTGQFTFVFFVGSVGALLSLFAIVPQGGIQKEAVLILFVSFALSAVAGLVLVQISGVSKKDL